MRIKIDFTVPNTPIPNDIWVVNSFIHAELFGVNNDYHDISGEYCISHLCGGKLSDDKNFKIFDENHTPFIFITSDNKEFISNVILKAVLNKPSLGYGATVKNVTPIDEQFYNGLNHFFVLSPVLLKHNGRLINILTKDDENKYTIINSEYSDLLKSHIIKKFSKINPNLDFTNFDIKIDTEGCKVYNMVSKQILNPSSSFQITLTTNKKVAQTIYNIGLGKSTNSGFGTIYKTENHELYKF